ncbi:MAG: GNAT family N-acetyltransferase [Candidatus Heimdallarchaeota archaeon]
MFTIRPFIGTEDEYQALVDVENTVWPTKSSLKSMKEFDQEYTNQFFSRIVATVENKLVAYAMIFDPIYSSEPDYYQLSITVLPDFRKQGIGSALYNKCLKILMNRDPKLVSNVTYENHEDALTFLKKRGFSRVQRLPSSLLKLDDFKLEQFENSLNEIKEKGYRIVSVEEYKKMDRKWAKKLWTLHIGCIQDVPSSTEIAKKPFESYKTKILPKLDLNFFVIALDGKNPVGLSILWGDEDEPDKMYTSLTGTLRSHRRQKIATALKVTNILKAKEKEGITFIETENDETNPMFQLNLALGFIDIPAKLVFHKKF